LKQFSPVTLRGDSQSILRPAIKTVLLKTPQNCFSTGRAISIRRTGFAIDPLICGNDACCCYPRLGRIYITSPNAYGDAPHSAHYCFFGFP
jgi:hypothetical protein